jgi:hypothetical protein
MRIEDVIGEENKIRVYAESLGEGNFLMTFHMLMTERFKTDKYGWGGSGGRLVSTGRAKGPSEAYIEFEYCHKRHEEN